MRTIDWRSPRNILSDYMCYHMPLYYVLSGQIVYLLSSNGNVTYQYPNINPNYDKNPSMFVHEKRDVIWNLDQSFAMIVLRIVSILLGFVVLLVTFKVGRLIFPDQKVVAIMAVTLLALWPQFLFMSRAITNDSLATALAVTVLLILLRVGVPKRFPLATLIAVLAFLTKLSVAFVLGVVVIVWFVELLVYKEKRQTYLRVILMSGAILLGFGLILRLNPILWAKWQHSTTNFSANRLEIWQPIYWQQVYTWTLNSGWAWFGWLRIRPSAIHAQIWWLVVQICVVFGIYIASKRVDMTQKKLLLWICTIWVIAIFVSYIRVTSNRWQPQFRFIFAVLPLLTTFTAGGMLAWIKRDSVQIGLLLSMAIILISYNIWLIYRIIIPAYQIL